MVKMKQILSLALALILSLSLAMPALAAETAANIQLTKTEGTVTVSKSNGKAVSTRANMRLYNGYNVTTEAESYAWINLDSTKLMKLDASSSVEVRKNGSKLEVNVKSGTKKKKPCSCLPNHVPSYDDYVPSHDVITPYKILI